MAKGMMHSGKGGGLAKEHNPYGRVLHDRDTSSKPSPPTGIGDERKPNPKGAQEGGSRAEAAGTRGELGPGHSHLGHAAEELHKQHPHHHSHGGIHHTSDHIRHEPHGAKHR